MSSNENDPSVAPVVSEVERRLTNIGECAKRILDESREGQLDTRVNTFGAAAPNRSTAPMSAVVETEWGRNSGAAYLRRLQLAGSGGTKIDELVFVPGGAHMDGGDVIAAWDPVGGQPLLPARMAAAPTELVRIVDAIDNASQETVTRG